MVFQLAAVDLKNILLMQTLTTYLLSRQRNPDNDNIL